MKLLVLAFDTATDVATSALVDDGEVLGERSSRAVTLLEDVDALLRQGGMRPRGAADEGRLPGAELAGDVDDVARPQPRREIGRDALRLLRGT